MPSSIRSYLTTASNNRHSRNSWTSIGDDRRSRTSRFSNTSFPPLPSPIQQLQPCLPNRNSEDLIPFATPQDPFDDSYYGLYPVGTNNSARSSVDRTALPKPSQSKWSYESSHNGSTESLASSHHSITDTPIQPKNTSRVGKFFSSCKNKVYQHLDPNTLIGIIDIREIFWPMTWKKYAVLALVSGLIAAIAVTEIMFHWIESAMHITRKNMLPVLVVVIGLEPIMMVLILLVARIPKNEEQVEPGASSDVDITEQMANLEKNAITDVNPHATALVIPCHDSDHVAMKRVLESAYPHFRPQDIFIVDNGRSRYPKDSTFREFIRSENAEINYIWSPIGSKNAAQLIGAMAAKNHQFIMTVDDDVCIPANFKAPVDLVDDKVKGVAFPLKATNAAGKIPLFMVAWQDCEYRMAGLTKLAESQICGVLFPHGAGWFCERDTLIDLISNYHSIDFIAEDVNTGISMQKMKKRIAFDARCILETEVPTTVFGQGLNWYKQRVRSWEMGRHGRFFAFAGRLFLSLNGQTTPWGIFTQKFIHFYSLACIIVDWVRVPVLVTMGTKGVYWRQAGLLTLASILPLMWFRYISCRRRADLRPTFWGSLTYPVYKQLYSLVSIIGAIRSVVFYIGGHQTPKNIREMVKDGDGQAFWLDPRFETNPGYLADEGEYIRSAAAEAESIKEEKGGQFATLVIERPSIPASIFAAWERPRTLSPASSSSSLDRMQHMVPPLGI